jgi:lysine N6-hydroxylase
MTTPCRQAAVRAIEERDVVAIGCGPFNLGLLALASTVAGLDVVGFEAREELSWHSGMMFDDARLQLSFLADLVTLIDPTHWLSFLCYLRESDRLYPFFIRETFHPTRREYEAYLRWVASKLPSARLSHRVTNVHWDVESERFVVKVLHKEREPLHVLARDLVIGIGTEPALPEGLARLPHSTVFHSADYLHRLADVERAAHVTVVGSGQSGAEVMLDLLRRNLAGGGAVRWLTRTCSFAPLDYTKLVLEMTTPAYVRYFYGLPQATKDRLVAEQWQHYKGISHETLDQLHDALYQRELRSGLAPVELRCGTTVEAACVDQAGSVVLTCIDGDTNRVFETTTELVIAATGYRERTPTFLAGLERFIRRDEQGRYVVRQDYSVELTPGVAGRIFVVNAELHSHGVATPDLGMGAFRNATILNAISGRELYRLPRRTAFTTFGPATDGQAADAPRHPAGSSAGEERQVP